MNCTEKFIKHSERVGSRFAELNAGASLPQLTEAHTLKKPTSVVSRGFEPPKVDWYTSTLDSYCLLTVFYPCLIMIPSTLQFAQSMAPDVAKTHSRSLTTAIWRCQSRFLTHAMRGTNTVRNTRALCQSDIDIHITPATRHRLR